MIDVTKPLMCGDDVAVFSHIDVAGNIGVRINGMTAYFKPATGRHWLNQRPPLHNGAPEPAFTLDQAKALIEAAGGTVTMPEPEIDYEACIPAVTAYFERYAANVAIPFGDGEKRCARALIAAAKLLPAEYRG